jgi:hypothetical protein
LTGRRPHAEFVDDLPLERLDVVVGEEQHLLRAQHRHARTQRGKLRHRARDAQHVRDTHPVQGAVLGAVGRVQVGIEVDVDDTDALRPSKRAGDRAELDRAVTPHHQHCRVGREGGSDVLRGGPGDRRGGIRIHGTRVHLVRTPAETGNVSTIVDRDAVVGQEPRQPSSAESSRGLLVAGRICAGATWRADDGQVRERG